MYENVLSLNLFLWHPKVPNFVLCYVLKHFGGYVYKNGPCVAILKGTRIFIKANKRY